MVREEGGNGPKRALCCLQARSVSSGLVAVLTWITERWALFAPFRLTLPQGRSWALLALTYSSSQEREREPHTGDSQERRERCKSVSLPVSPDCVEVTADQRSCHPAQ